MSLSDCGHNCTSCPSCRGEVSATSASMMTLSWASAQATDLRQTSPFWYVAKVEHVYREARIAAGKWHNEPDQVLDHVVSAAALLARDSASNGHGLGQPWRSSDLESSALDERGRGPHPGFSFDEASAPSHQELIDGEAPEVRRLRQEAMARRKTVTPQQAHPGETVTVETNRVERETHRRYGFKSDEDWTSKVNPECCLVDFKYPSLFRVWQQNLSRVPGHYRAGVRFEAELLYSDEKPSCECDCCEFVQSVMVLRSQSVFVGGSVGKPGPDARTPREKKLREDCIWYDDRETDPKSKRPKYHLEEDPPPITDQNREHIHVVCFGDGDAGEHAHSAYKSSDCSYWMCDAPEAARTPLEDTTIVDVRLWMGEVYDTCRKKLKRREIFVSVCALRELSVNCSMTRINADGGETRSEAETPRAQPPPAEGEEPTDQCRGR